MAAVVLREHAPQLSIALRTGYIRLRWTLVQPSRVRVPEIENSEGPFVRLLHCIRWDEVLVLQGPPLLGALAATPSFTGRNMALVAELAIASCLLVAHVFVLNDWSGRRGDLRDPNRASNALLARSLNSSEAIGMCLALLALSLILFAPLGIRPLIVALAIASASGLYSAPPSHGKGVPFVNSMLHLGGGILHFLLGYSLFRPIGAQGVAIGCFFGLTFMAGHFTHEARDHEGDFVNGIRTNAVQFGATKSFVAGLMVFTISYATLVLLAVRGIVPRALVAAAGLYPLHLYWSLRALREGLSFQRICQVQRRYRALYALIGIGMALALAARTMRAF